MTTVKFVKIKKKANPPEKKAKEAAGFDVYACLDESVDIHPMERKIIPTGLTLEIPKGYHISVRPRSGLAFHHGITLPNAPGTIDQDYRGELSILMINLGGKIYTIQHGDRIAQLLLEPVLQICFEECSLESMSKTERGSRGFGSTGI